MRSCLSKFLSIVLFAAGLATFGFASPLASKLLSLVPANSEIVAGFENRHDPHSSGRLVLATQNNRLDLEDWVSLSGVDTTRIFDEVIEVSSSSARGELKEHLLLIAGHFDGRRIFSSAKLNGAEISDYEGEKVLLIKPFAREQGQMLDERWLIILNDQTGLLGTPVLVQEALHRYARHASPDTILTERLARMRPDVTSWNVLVSSNTVANNVAFVRSHASWTQLFEDAELLTVGARFGSKIRVDFAIQPRKGSEAADFSQKAEYFSQMFVEPAAAEDDIPSQASRPRLENFTVGPSRVQGSIALSEKQFNRWISAATLIQISHAPARTATTPLN